MKIGDKARLIEKHIINRQVGKILKAGTIVKVVSPNGDIVVCDYGGTKNTPIPLKILEKI